MSDPVPMHNHARKRSIACKATYPTSSKEQPPKPQPEITCPAGSFDPSLKVPPKCPKGSTCCCTRDYFWKIGQCKDTTCCLEDETCVNQGGNFGKHGCFKNSTLGA